MKTLLCIVLNVLLPLDIVSIVCKHPFVKLNRLILVLAHRIEVSNQVVKDVSEQDWLALMLEELLAHDIEVIEREPIRIHLVVLFLQEVVEVLPDS